jgi:Uma2 family endonuclease
MAMPAPTQPGTLLTAEDLYELPDGGRHHELVRGRLCVSEPPGFSHGAISTIIAATLLAYVRPRGLGTVTVESGYVLARGPDTVRGPDVTFLAAAREPTADVAHRFYEGAPDLAVEVLSPDDRASEVAEKVDEYFAAGTRLVWVVNPKTRSVTVHTPDGIARILRESDTIDGGDVIPGFTCSVAELFPERRSIH